MRITVMIFMLAAMLASVVAQEPTRSQKKSVNEPGITEEQAAKIIQELQMIRMLLEKETAKRPASDTLRVPADQRKTGQGFSERALDTLGADVMGSEKAPVALVEFVDLQCPFCIEFHNEVLPDLRRKYINTGELRFAVFDFPLPSHAYAVPAAELAHCAASQGKYWRVYDAFLSAPEVATPDVIERIAEESQLDSKKLDACLASKGAAGEIDHEESLGRSLGVVGTPTFLLGRSVGTGVTGQLIEGAPSWAELDARIQALLTQPTAQQHPPVSHQ